jgi:hypothetical protein
MHYRGTYVITPRVDVTLRTTCRVLPFILGRQSFPLFVTIRLSVGIVHTDDRGILVRR